MIKTGIYKIEQLSALLDNGKINNIDKNFAITLYSQILNNPNAEAIAERILLLFTDERGAYKRTYANRFESFDKEMLQILQKHFLGADNIAIHDVGVSDARTALDLFKKVVMLYPNVNFYASDYDPTVYVIERGKLKLVLSANKKLLQIIWAPFVFNKIKRDSYRRFPINHIVRIVLEKLFVKKLVQKYTDKQIKATQYHLFSPQSLNLAKHDKRFCLQQHDVLNAFGNKYHVIRAMNILNASYFNTEEFDKVIKNLHDGLHVNGLLIVGSNQDVGSIVDGAIYKKTATGFERIYKTGSDIHIDSKLLEYTI